MINVLIADDDSEILELMEYNLQKEGYTVHTALDGKEALAKALAIQPDLIILDVMMPFFNGIEVCSQLRENPLFKNTVIIFSSARDEDFTQLSAYDAGADDYFVKPLKPKIFMSRLKAWLKRLNREETTNSSLLKIADLEIDKDQYLVYKNGTLVKLVKKEFELLVLLISKPKKVFSREEIIDGVWESDTIVGNRTIDVHIRKLREKIGAEYFETIIGVGYKFIIPENK